MKTNYLHTTEQKLALDRNNVWRAHTPIQTATQSRVSHFNTSNITTTKVWQCYDTLETNNAEAKSQFRAKGVTWWYIGATWLRWNKQQPTILCSELFITFTCATVNASIKQTKSQTLCTLQFRCNVIHQCQRHIPNACRHDPVHVYHTSKSSPWNGLTNIRNESTGTLSGIQSREKMQRLTVRLIQRHDNCNIGKTIGTIKGDCHDGPWLMTNEIYHDNDTTTILQFDGHRVVIKFYTDSW